MDKRIYEMHAHVCKVLSNAKRLEVIDLLRDGEKTVTELQKKMKIAKSNLSQQLAIMREKGILEARRDGQRIFYRLAHPRMLKAYDLLREILFEQMEKKGALGLRFQKESSHA